MHIIYVKSISLSHTNTHSHTRTHTKALRKLQTQIEAAEKLASDRIAQEAAARQLEQQRLEALKAEQDSREQKLRQEERERQEIEAQKHAEKAAEEAYKMHQDEQKKEAMRGTIGLGVKPALVSGVQSGFEVSRLIEGAPAKVCGKIELGDVLVSVVCMYLCVYMYRCMYGVAAKMCGKM